MLGCGAQTVKVNPLGLPHFFDPKAMRGQLLQEYPGAVACLVKDRDVLLEFYNFPADHWTHLRTTNPVESTFATVRLRHRRTKGSGSRNASLAMVFKPASVAQKSWCRLNGHQLITKLVEGYLFKDGIMQERDAA